MVLAKKWFICVLVAAILLIILMYAFTEIIFNEQAAVPVRTQAHHEYGSGVSAAMLADRMAGSDLRAFLSQDRHKLPEIFTNESSTFEEIPKEQLNFYRSRMKVSSRRGINKILKEVPPKAHKLAMVEIQKTLRISMKDFVKMRAEKQNSIYVKALELVGYTKRLPTVINIGAKKAGTTALGLFLRAHPQVASSLGNEIHYFDWNYDKGIDFYRSRFQYATESQEVFEKTPRYFITDDVPRRIKEDVSPDVKIILIVRDPVERAVSDYHHESELIASRTSKRKRLNMVESKQPLTRGPPIEDTFQDTVLKKNGDVNDESELIHIGKYAMHLRRWLEYFPMNQILVIDGTEISIDPLKQMQVLEHFLDLEPYFTQKHFVYNKARHVYCLAIPETTCRFSTSHKIPKPVLSDSLRKTLYEFYRPYNQELVEMLNQTFSWIGL